VPSAYLLFLGTYTRTRESKGIYCAWLDRASGRVGPVELAAPATDPAWLTQSPDGRFLYAIHASPGQAIAFRIDGTTGRLTPLPGDPAASTVNPPSHLAVDANGRTLLAANYRDGYVSRMAIRADGTTGPAAFIRHEGRGPHPTRQDRPHPHSVTVSPDNRHVLVADLGLDRVYTYALDDDPTALTPAQPPFVATAAGAGPRHSAFGADGRHVYVINELNSTIDVHAFDSAHGALTLRQTVSTLPADFTGENIPAEIRVHPNGRFAYGSTRGHDSIASFAIDAASGRLTCIGFTPTGGRNPRNFALSPDGAWLVCGHQDTPRVTVFRLDPATGQLAPTDHFAEVPAVVCVLFHR
jgi:6-phosphogluconolactonase